MVRPGETMGRTALMRWPEWKASMVGRWGW